MSRPGAARTFAEKLEFALRHRGQPHHEVAARARTHGVVTASPDWLSALASGTTTPHPSEQRALAQALQVPRDYFTEPYTTAVVDAVLVLGATLRSRGVQLIGPCRRTPSAADYLALYAELASG